MEQHQIEIFCSKNIADNIQLTFLDGSVMVGNALEPNDILFFSEENMWLLHRPNQPSFSFLGDDIIDIKII